MNLLYLDCQMGAAGDMLSAALLELFPQPEEMIRKLNTIGIPNVEFCRIQEKKCGVLGTRMSVKISGREEDSAMYAEVPGSCNKHMHHHHCFDDIRRLIEPLQISTKVKSHVLSVYALLAEAESHVHGETVSQIHFHEVGNLDAVADITAVCYLINELSPDRILASPIHVGSGQVRCAHGILPVPAPATAFLLQGCPIYSEKISGELCTPTGAALLKYFVMDFCELPAMIPAAIGYGMGKKDFPRANCVRALFGTLMPEQTTVRPSPSCTTADLRDFIWELSCNVDDMTAEQIGCALDRFFKDGALDAYTIPLMMKKSRPGTLIQVLCKEETKEALIRSMFCHTTTAGIREQKLARSILHRELATVETPYGKIRRKDYSGYGTMRSKYEYEDLASAADEHGVSIFEISKNLET